MAGIRLADSGRYPCRESRAYAQRISGSSNRCACLPRTSRDRPRESPMTSVRSVLVVGGGTAGCALATLLGRAGVAVEIVERKPGFTTYGSGITLQGAALRLLAEIPDARTGGPDLPATLGAYRPKLAEVLAAAAGDVGAKVRCGATVESFTQDADGVDVVFAGGDMGRYDLLVGADGVRSQIRRQLGIDVAPQPVGMGIWRVHTRRPADVERTDLIYDGPCYIAGY